MNISHFTVSSILMSGLGKNCELFLASEFPKSQPIDHLHCAKANGSNEQWQIDKQVNFASQERLLSHKKVVLLEVKDHAKQEPANSSIACFSSVLGTWLDFLYRRKKVRY